MGAFLPFAPDRARREALALLVAVCEAARVNGWFWWMVASDGKLAVGHGTEQPSRAGPPAAPAARHGDVPAASGPPHDTARVRPLAWLHGLWEATGRDAGIENPISPLVRAWQSEKERPASNRPDPFLPRIGTVGPERERGERLLGGLVPDHAHPAAMPLFPEVSVDRAAADAETRAPILELADRSGVQSMAQGRGAPLDLRLVVESVLSVEYELRTMASVRIVWTVQELLSGLFDGRYRMTPRGDRPGDWQRTRQALLAANERWIPWQNGGCWWLLRVRGLPSERPQPTDKVIVDVALPPGSAAGPVMDRAALRKAGVESAPAYRTLIGVSTLAFRPGTTRIPTPGVGAVWTGDPSRYPVLTPEARRRIAFGAADTRRQARVDDAIRDVDGVTVIDAEATDKAGRKGWRIVPDAAADAIRKWLSKGRK